MFVNTNVSALQSVFDLQNTTNSMSTVLQQLSTGLQINSAADNPAGLAISQEMQTQISGLNQASQNSQNGISLLQTADGAMSNIDTILQSMRSLASQAATGTNNPTDLQALQTEMNQYAQEITNIANTTQFNNLNLLSGAFGGQTGGAYNANGQYAGGTLNPAGVENIQIGANQGEQISMGIDPVDAYSLNVAGVNAVYSGNNGFTGTVSESNISNYVGNVGNSLFSSATGATNNYTIGVGTVTIAGVDVGNSSNGLGGSGTIQGAASGSHAAGDVVGSFVNANTVTYTISITGTSVGSVTATLDGTPAAGFSGLNATNLGTYLTSVGSGLYGAEGTTYTVGAVSATAAGVSTNSTDALGGSSTALTISANTSQGSLSGTFTGTAAATYTIDITGVNTTSGVITYSVSNGTATTTGLTTTAATGTATATAVSFQIDASGVTATVYGSAATIGNYSTGQTAVVGFTPGQVGLGLYTTATTTGGTLIGSTVTIAGSNTQLNSAITLGSSTNANEQVQLTNFGDLFGSGTNYTNLQTLGGTISAASFGFSFNTSAASDQLTYSVTGTDGFSATGLTATASTTAAAANNAFAFNDAGSSLTVYGQATLSGYAVGQTATVQMTPGSIGLGLYSGSSASAANLVGAAATVSGTTVNANLVLYGSNAATSTPVVLGDTGSASQVTLNDLAGLLGSGTTSDYGNLTTIGGTLTSSSLVLNFSLSSAGQAATVAGDGIVNTAATVSNGINISTQGNAEGALTVIDQALTDVNAQRAVLGAYQNELQFAASNAQTGSNNLSSAQANILDTNMALQMANLSKDQVLQQSGIAMLAQADQMPQAILKLIG